MFLTRSPLGLHLYCYKMDLVRLACVKPAASVRPEPGSNSPSRTTDLHRDRSGKSVGLGGNNPKDPVPNLLFFFVCEMDWNPSRIDRQYRRPKSPYCPHCCSVFSSVFKELMLSACTPKGSDTDPQKHSSALEGRVAMLTAVKTHLQHGFQRNPEVSRSVEKALI